MIPNFEQIQQYKIDASRTMAQLGEPIHDSMHMVIGMCTESAELLQAFSISKLDLINISEEIGDLMWYVANYATIHQLEMNYFPYDCKIQKRDIVEKIVRLFTGNNTSIRIAKEILNKIIVTIGNIQDLDKKKFAYKKEYDTVELKENFASLTFLISNLCFALSLDLVSIMSTNIAKLRKRYPNKFTEYDALNRDLKAEREILES